MLDEKLCSDLVTAQATEVVAVAACQIFFRVLNTLGINTLNAAIVGENSSSSESPARTAILLVTNNVHTILLLVEPAE